MGLFFSASQPKLGHPETMQVGRPTCNLKFPISNLSGRFPIRTRVPLSEPIPGPQRNLTRSRTEGVDPRIPRRSRPAGHERLMKFIERRISRGNRQCRNRPAQLPSATLPANHAKQQEAEQEIFHDVSRLAYAMIEKGQHVNARGWKKPVQYRSDDRARVFRRK